MLSGAALITVSGPGVAPGGATEWSLAATTGANGCTYPSSATWYVGPLSSSPLASRLAAAKITSTALSYGVIGGEECFYTWPNNALIGLSQTGNKITIVSFTLNGVDYNVPVDQISYTLQ